MELAEWADRYGAVAGITTRGQAGGPGFSLGLWSEEPVGQVMTRWRAFRTAFGARFPTIILSHQVHGVEVTWHGSTGAGWHILDGVDGHATAAAGHLLTVTVADCIPVYLAVPQKRIVAVIHAGWRGTAGRILERAVALLKREAFCRGSDIAMHCGVGICGACYEVGSEVYEKVTGKASPGPAHVDLRAVLATQAAELGVQDTTVSSFCTAHDRDRFFSHRASGGRDGRLVAYAGFPRA
jgi:polyphenol oxidase